jgi:hypothetical protein
MLDVEQAHKDAQERKKKDRRCVFAKWATLCRPGLSDVAYLCLMEVPCGTGHAIPVSNRQGN